MATVPEDEVRHEARKPTSERPSLRLFGYESSAHCRLVREKLSTLQLRYEMITVADGCDARKLEMLDAELQRGGIDASAFSEHCDLNRAPVLIGDGWIAAGSKACVRELSVRFGGSPLPPWACIPSPNEGMEGSWAQNAIRAYATISRGQKR